MHYFNRNIGDYHKKAGRLSMLEHGAYTLLMDSCYDREKFPTKEDAFDWCWARTDEEKSAVEFVLGKFFHFEGGVYIQLRIADEIEEYKIKGLINQLVAISREARKKNKIEFSQECDQLKTEIKDAPLSKSHKSWKDLIEKLTEKHATCKSVQKRTPNQEPRTKNQEPRTKNQEPITNNQEPNRKNNSTNRTDSNSSELVDSCFEKFWKSGLRKDNRKKCFSIFSKILKKQSDPEKFTAILVDDIQRRVKSDQLGFDRMLPTTYLNGERWTDSHDEPVHANCPHAEIYALYHEILPELPSVTAGIWKGSSAEQTLTKRWLHSEKTQNLDTWKRFFEGVRQVNNGWYLGNNASHFRPDLEFLIKEENFRKLVDLINDFGRRGG